MKNLSFAQEKYLLVALVLLLSWLAWQLAFKKTFEVYSRYKVLSGYDENYSGVSYPEAYSIRKKQNLETILRGYVQDSTSFKNNLLYQVSYQANRQNIKVIQVPMQEKTIYDQILQRVTFQGSYFGLIRLLNDLKTVGGVGKVRSVKVWQPTQNNKMTPTTMDIYFVCLNTEK